MSIEIPVAHVEMYRGNVIMLAQQKGSRLMRTCRNDGAIVGRTCYFDRIGAVDAQEITTRHADTPLTSTPHSRRRADMRDFDYADLVDRIDRIRTIYQPDNYYAQAGAWAIGRKMDDQIISAASGSVYEGQSGGTTTALPAGQKIAHGSAGLTVVKILSAKEILDASDVDPDLPRYFVLDAEGVTDLLNTTEIKSSDYNTVKALAQGQINTFCGFEFIRSQRITGSGDTTKYGLAYTAQALGFGMGSELMVDIGPRRDKRNATQIYVSASFAVTRIEDEQLVEVAYQ